MLFRQIERIRCCTEIDGLVVATSLDSSDDKLASACADEGVYCYRGSLHDVLDRVYRAAESYKATDVVRLTGDCPLADPLVIDSVIREYFNHNDDYASNTLLPSFPDGLDVEVCRFEALERAWREATLPSQREHVTPYIYAHPEMFRLQNVASKIDLSDLRWTVDCPSDFEFVTAIYQELYSINANFGTDDILKLLRQNPKIAMINSSQIRNEGYRKSLDEESLARAEHNNET